ncbi:MAG: sensor histidine kinase [Alphaproteobacteria bacterium]|jgi:signal transduction histidine kinase|nr:sensor histidine kinase [Alphaproteobacteria bacterium]
MTRRRWDGLIVVLGLLASLLLTGLPGPAAAQPVLRFGPADRTASLNGHMALLLDPGGRHALGDVIALPLRDRFEPLPVNLSLGYTPVTAWIRIVLENTGPASRPLYLELEPAFLDHVDVFSPAVAVPSGAADFREIRLGDHVAVDDKPVFSINNVVPIDLPPGQARAYYIRLQTSSSLMLRGAVRTSASLNRHTADILLAMGLYVGLAVAVAAINLIFWLWVRSRTHLWYAAYVLSLAASAAAIAGVVPIWLFPGHPAWSDLVVGSSSFLACTTCSYFAIHLLETRQRSPILHWVYHVTAIYGLVGVAATFLGYYQTLAGTLMVGGVIALFSAAGQSYRLARQGFAPAKLFLISFAAQLVGLTVNVARVVGLLPTLEWTDYSYQAASAIHMILMNIGLAQRMKEADNRARLAQAEALALAQQAELRAQAIATERTRDLAAAKQRAEAALAAEQEAQRAQVRFIDVISHQYRTPLSVIATNIEGIGMSLAEADAPNRRRIDRIRRAVGRLVAMIDVSLNRSRLDGQPLAPQLRPLAPAPMLRQAVQRVRDATGDRIIGLEFDDSVDAAVLLADSEMIELALTNLIENALKFSDADRPVDVTAKVERGALRIDVHDQGIGIPQAELGQIFGKFYRAANAASRPGVGIGLQLVAQLVRAHGGQVTVDSAEGRGSTFSIILPLATIPA